MDNFSLRRAAVIVSAIVSAIIGSPVFAASDADLALPAGCTLSHPQAISESIAPGPKFPATQLQIRTPFVPTLFASAGRHYLVYELHIQNFSDSPVILRTIDVLDTDQSSGKNIMVFPETLLNDLVRPVGGGGQYARQTHVDSNRQINAGQSAIAFLCLSFDRKVAAPRHLRHRLYLENERIDGPVVDVSQVPVPQFGRLLVGSDWRPRNGPHVDSHHRMGIWVGEGIAQISRRYAIDWLRYRNGEQLAGDPRKLDSYFAYGEKVLSVADGVVVRAADGFPDNIPKTAAGFETALPVTMENLGGNTIVLKLANGQFAAYLHLQPGSVGVKVGDRVKKGQVIAKVGNSGDSRWPHLHFQVTTNPTVLESEGLPFVFDHFRMKVGSGEWMVRANEFPWGDETVIDFGEARFKMR